MYGGHYLLVAILIVILILLYGISQKRNYVFPYVCRVISVFFLMVTIVYCYDMVTNPTKEGFRITWAMYFLAQNEDFLSKNGSMIGIYWGVGIIAVTFLLSFIPTKKG